MQCSDDRLHMFNNSCYLFVSYPEVTWATAQQICTGLKARLTSILTPEEDKFITTNIRKMSEYRTSAKYWLGGRMDSAGEYFWADGNRMTYSGWLPGRNPTYNDIIENTMCLAVQWMPSPTPMLPSGLYWIAQKCTSTGGYVCKRQNQISGTGANFNESFKGSEGQLMTPNYPSNYYNNLDFSVHLVAPERSRIVITFEKIEIEPQLECLYDYILLKSLNNNQPYDDATKLCGNHDTLMNRFDFVSKTNDVLIQFHSDYSITGGGFFLNWRSVDVSGCPMQTLTAKEGILTSPNYPHFLLSNLDCTVKILAPVGQRIWLEFEDFDLGQKNDPSDSEAVLEIKLGKRSTFFRPFQTEGLLTEGTFISHGDQLHIRLRTKEKPNGIGFKATYKTMGEINVEKVIKLSNSSIGHFLHLNYPNPPANNIDFFQRFVAPLGNVILLELYHFKISDQNCSNSSDVIIYDNYSDSNGTNWSLCYDSEDDPFISKAPIAIMSFLNTLILRQRNGASGTPLNGTLRVQQDRKYVAKILKFRTNVVEFCYPNPCLHGGKCLTKGQKKYCQCQGHYTGKLLFV